MFEGIFIFTFIFFVYDFIVFLIISPFWVPEGIFMYKVPWLVFTLVVHPKIA
jgi:hypothetical protein